MQDITANVNSEDLSTHMAELNHKGIQILIVNVDGGWEENLTPSRYKLDSLRDLILRSTLVHSANQTRTTANPLIQWMPQLQSLDIVDLNHDDTMVAVYRNFPISRLRVLKLGSFGLLCFWEFCGRAVDIGILSSVRSIQCTFDGAISVALLSSLQKWCRKQDDNRERNLTLIFPMWDMYTHETMAEYAAREPIDTSPVKLHKLDIRILEVENITENDENTLKLSYESPFFWFRGDETQVHFFLRLQDVNATIAMWTKEITKLAQLAITDTRLNIHLIFTKKWKGFTDIFLKYVIKDMFEEFVNAYIVVPTTHMSDVHRLGIEKKMKLVLYTPTQYISFVSQFLDVTLIDNREQQLYEKCLENGDIKYELYSRF